MSKQRSVTLGGVEYPLPKFKLGAVAELSATLSNVGDAKTLPGVQARNTVIWKAISLGGYTGKFTDFLEMEDVSALELVLATNEIGRAIGFFKEADENVGEAAGTETSP